MTSLRYRRHHFQSTSFPLGFLIAFSDVPTRLGLAQKRRLWLGFGGLRLCENLGRAKAATGGLAPAWLGPSRGFWHTTLFRAVGGHGGIGGLCVVIGTGCLSMACERRRKGCGYSDLRGRRHVNLLPHTPRNCIACVN